MYNESLKKYGTPARVVIGKKIIQEAIPNDFQTICQTNEQIEENRFEELVQLYENPILATVRRVQEEFEEGVFRKFMSDCS